MSLQAITKSPGVRHAISFAFGASVFIFGFQSALAATDDSKSCPRYKIYYIDPAAQFFTPPVPLEDNAEFIFCSDHANLDEIRAKLKKLKPIRSQADAGAGRIKVVPRGHPEDAIIFCSTGEITYKGKQYRLDRRLYEPSLLSIREKGDRQRSLAIENEEGAYRDPASQELERQLRNLPMKDGTTEPALTAAPPNSVATPTSAAPEVP